ncbi:MAG: hypothetical protein IID52_03080 [Proteobacteria bacterium]|nr:hypothetical protein [Pseudomonadota bacterium]MCH8322260.1 hypothetical protein [Pseudomonadota bacterium]
MNKLTKISLAIGLATVMGLSSISIAQEEGKKKEKGAQGQGANATEPWTDWLDRDNPSGKGDYETVKDFVAAGIIDPGPLGIQCRTLGGQPWQAAGQVYSCDATVGGVCVNSKQVGGAQCLDYEVRFRYQPNKP